MKIACAKKPQKQLKLNFFSKKVLFKSIKEYPTSLPSRQLSNAQPACRRQVSNVKN